MISELDSIDDAGLLSARAEQVVNVLQEFVSLSVDHPEAVRVKWFVAADGSTDISIILPAKDAGKIIGRNGRTARSLRVLLGVMSARALVRFRLDIVAEDYNPIAT